MLPKKLKQKLKKRQQANALRVLPMASDLVDFSSNDYLGFSNNLVYAKAISNRTQEILQDYKTTANGATGSRLLTGNHSLYALAEKTVSHFHNSETALIFNSGYDANIGFFQSVPQRNDVILYDSYIHASIRDGLQLSLAKSYKFLHNDLSDIESLLKKYTSNLTVQEQVIYVVTESVFSMDGDSPDLTAIANLCEKYDAHLVVDEAHATGVLGCNGNGLVPELKLEEKVFARVVTFGKAMGAHGAVILGSTDLKDYLINYARSFIYTTGLPPHSIATVIAGYEQLLKNDSTSITKLRSTIDYFTQKLTKYNLASHFITSNSAIHCTIIAGNENVKTLSRKLKNNNFDVKPILSPTVKEGEERLRICLHAYNTREEMDELLRLIKENI